MLREAMRLVSNVLQQLQAKIASRQPQRLRSGLHVNPLFLLRQRDHHRRADVHRLEDFQRRVQLPEATVDEDDVGIKFVVLPRLTITA